MWLYVRVCIIYTVYVSRLGFGEFTVKLLWFFKCDTHTHSHAQMRWKYGKQLNTLNVSETYGWSNEWADAPPLVCLLTLTHQWHWSQQRFYTVNVLARYICCCHEHRAFAGHTKSHTLLYRKAKTRKRSKKKNERLTIWCRWIYTQKWVKALLLLLWFWLLNSGCMYACIGWCFAYSRTHIIIVAIVCACECRLCTNVFIFWIADLWIVWLCQNYSVSVPSMSSF